MPVLEDSHGLLKQLEFVFKPACVFLCASDVPVFSPSQRSAEDLEVIYEELLHVKAAAHLSTSVSRSII